MKLIVILSLLTAPLYSQTLGTFNLSEQFGIPWPDQPIEFRYDGGNPGSTAKMIGPLGSEVAYQWVSSCSDTTALLGCIAVRNNLPANSAYTWTLTAGTPSAIPTHPVALNMVGNNYEMTNGLTGVRIVTAAANTSPYNLAPIQGILLADGMTWTAAGSSANLLYSQDMADAGNIGIPMKTPMFAGTGYSVTVTDSGPLKTVLTVNYTFNRPNYSYGGGMPYITTAGSGHYAVIVTLYANSKSVLIDEDTDMVFSYLLPIYAQVSPDTARWRGADSIDSNGHQDTICGYEQAVTVTGATNATPIVVTLASAPNEPLSDEQAVTISGVGGNTSANGSYYLKATGFSSTQFALYSNSGLVTPVAGNGAYTSGGTAKVGYRGQAIAHNTPDAYEDLTYGGSDRTAAAVCSATNYRKLVIAYPQAAHSGGWYVEMYNSAAGSTAPVVGFYIGRASQQVYSGLGPSVPGIYTSTSDWVTGSQSADIQVDFLLRSGPGATPCDPPASFPCNPSLHRNWGIFVSTQADLLAPSLHQPIATEQNSLTEVNLSRLYTYQLAYPDPVGGNQYLYLSPAGAAQLQSWVQNGIPVCGTTTCYAALLNGSDGQASSVALVGMWQGNSTAAVQTALGVTSTTAFDLEFVLAEGDGRFDSINGYYALGISSLPNSVVLNAILMNANTNSAQKAQAKAVLALMGCVFWDDDWFPIDNPDGESYGLANQIQQYLEYRTQSVFAAASQPFLATKLSQAITTSQNDFASYFSSTGSAAGSTHYQGTFFEPLILNYMNPLTQSSMPMTDPKWAAYANWELSIQTPPEPRFGNLRKGYSNGDGNTEGDVRTGMLATALWNKSTDQAAAGNLMWAWQNSNVYSPIFNSTCMCFPPTLLVTDNQFVVTTAVIDPSVPAIAPGTGGTPPLASINIPGYHSVERFNFGTPNETALWFINGDFYQTGGHRHYDDGQVSIYANSAPVSVDWNANLYYPETPGRWMHDSVVFDSEISPTLWTDDNTDVTLASVLFPSAANTEFESFGSSAHSIAQFTATDGTVWQRSVRTMNFNSSYPLIYVEDTFSGPSATASKTITWNMMATGNVSTSAAGAISPTVRLNPGCNAIANQPPSVAPSNGTVFGLAGGLNSFSFTGISWPAHASGGLDWDLWINAPDSSQQFLIGNWGHGCQSSNEATEFATANGVPFAETQHILRVNDTGSFTTLIAPYDKGATPTRTASLQSCGTQIVMGAETTCFNDSVATWTNGPAAKLLTVYDASTQAAFGVTASGGPQEVAITPTKIVWTISGITAGNRSVTLPSAVWIPTQVLSRTGNTFTVSFPGGAQTPPQSIVFLLNSGIFNHYAPFARTRF